MPADLDWELVVVNNGCTDHIDELIAAFAARLPVRREFEPQPGLSNARNRAVDAARGDYIVWTDDDVMVDFAWLAAYAEAFRRWPDAAVFGGPILPCYEAPVVKWVLEAEALLGDPYAVRDFGDAPLGLSVAEVRLPYGGELRNSRHGSSAHFGTIRNLDPGQCAGGSATRRMSSSASCARAKSGIGSQPPELKNCISRDRQTTGYIARYFAGYGETRAFLGASRGGPLWFGVPRWLWRQLLHSWVRYRFHRLQSPAPVWVRCLQEYACILGSMRYWRAQKTREGK